MASPLAAASNEIKYKGCFICFGKITQGLAASRTGQVMPGTDA